MSFFNSNNSQLHETASDTSRASDQAYPRVREQDETTSDTSRTSDQVYSRYQEQGVEQPTQEGSIYPPSQEQGIQGIQGKNAFNSDRPLGVAPIPEGGIANGGQPDLSEGNVNVADKLIGMTQKLIGKYTNNPDLHEKGEIRETGGRAAGEDRAAYD